MPKKDKIRFLPSTKTNRSKKSINKKEEDPDHIIVQQLQSSLKDIKDQIESHLDESTNTKKNKNGNTKRKRGPI